MLWIKKNELSGLGLQSLPDLNLVFIEHVPNGVTDLVHKYQVINNVHMLYC